MNTYSFDDFNKPKEQTGQQSAERTEWFSPREGSCRVRLVSNFVPVYRHWNKKPAIFCVGKERGCLLCETDKPNAEFMMLIIDRADAKLKIATFNKTIMEHVAALKNSTEYAFTGLFPEYDLIISKTFAGAVMQKNGESKNTYRWAVLASRNETPLTPDEQGLIAAEAARGTTVEQILERRVKKALKQISPAGATTVTASSLPVQTIPKDTLFGGIEHEEEDDFDLPQELK